MVFPIGGEAVDYLHESAVSIYRRRRRRRAVLTLSGVTMLLFATVVYAASFVEGWVGTATPKAVANASCLGTRPNQVLKPRDVTVNVFNSTIHVGLAATVANSLGTQGFKVATVDNDPLGRTVPGRAEIRHGQNGGASAALVAKRLPGATVVTDKRMDASVDLVLGNKFRKVIVPPKDAPPKGAPLPAPKPAPPC